MDNYKIKLNTMIQIKPHIEREKFQEYAGKLFDSRKETKDLRTIIDFLVEDHFAITGGNWGSYKASLTIYLGYNFPNLEKYADYIFEQI